MLNRKIAYINLSDGTVTKEEIPLEWRQKYLGARGINMYLLYSSVAPPYDPLGPENPLTIGAGLLTGVPGFGASRSCISALSPANGNLGDSNIGGHFGAELKYAGFDHLVIRGKSDTPVYILIRNDDIQIRDARHLWGKDAWETQLAIKEENKDDRIQTAAIGLAGQNLVRMASIMTGRKDTAGRWGMGAVMGSKNLKAIAVRGTKDVTFAHPQELLNYVQEQTDVMMTRKWIKAFGRSGTPLLFAYANEGGWLLPRNDQGEALGERGRALYSDNLDRYSQGKASCFGCAVHCRHRYHIAEGPYAGTNDEGPEYGAVVSLGANPEILDLEAVMRGSHLCNRLGLDVIDTGTMIAFAMELYERGIIGQEDVGKALEWGDADTMLSMIVDIANRKGFGDVLADGVYALNRLPPEADKHLLRIRNSLIVSIGGRVVKSWAFAQAVATLGGHVHRNRPGLDVLRLPAEKLQELYGGYVSPEYRSYDGKALMVRWHELLNAICDSLGCCRFQTAFNSPYCPNWEEYSALIRLSTGLDMPVLKLKEVGERIYTTERLLLGRLGVGSRKDDTLPESWFSEPVVGGAAAGEVLDRGKFEEFLDEYYALHGWDKNGIPTPEVVEQLGIGQVPPK